MKNYEKKLNRQIDQLAGKAKSAIQDASAKAHDVTKAANGNARGIVQKTGAKLQIAGKRIKSLLD